MSCGHHYNTGPFSYYHPPYMVRSKTSPLRYYSLPAPCLDTKPHLVRTAWDSALERGCPCLYCDCLQFSSAQDAHRGLPSNARVAWRPGGQITGENCLQEANTKPHPPLLCSCDSERFMVQHRWVILEIKVIDLVADRAPQSVLQGNFHC